MRVQEGRPERVAPLPIAVYAPLGEPVQVPVKQIPSGDERTLHYSMRHRTQLYLDEAQYRWLKQRAGEHGSIAAVVRELIDTERGRRLNSSADPLLSYLIDERPAKGRTETSVTTLDRDLYGR